MIGYISKKPPQFGYNGYQGCGAFFCPNMLISRAFGLLRYRSLPNSNDSPPPIQFSRELNGSGLSFIFEVIVSFVGYRLFIKSQRYKEKHGPMTKWDWIMLIFY